MKKVLFLFSLWSASFLVCFLMLLVVSSFYVPLKAKQVLGASIDISENQTELFASLPSTQPTTETVLAVADARAIIIKNYLLKFGAPEALWSEAEFIVAKSDEFGIDPRLIVAIARKESTFCKSVPKLPDGSSTNNCGGLGIFGQTVTVFDSVHDWIEAEIKFMSKAYFSQGITDLCEIEKSHTPTSGGRWCSEVKGYIAEME